jgi:hypothetical protein
LEGLGSVERLAWKQARIPVHRRREEGGGAGGMPERDVTKDKLVQLLDEGAESATLDYNWTIRRPATCQRGGIS